MTRVRLKDEPKKREKTGGRQKGTPNFMTTTIKDAVIQAAKLVGEDGKGRDALVGYMKRLAIGEPKAFASLLGRCLPLNLVGTIDHNHRTYESKEELYERLRTSGLPIDAVEKAIFGKDKPRNTPAQPTRH